MSICCASPKPDAVASPRTAMSRLLKAVRTAFLQGLADIRRAQRRSANIRTLDAMSDRQLRDIGIDRSEIPRAVDRALDTRKLPM